LRLHLQLLSGLNYLAHAYLSFHHHELRIGNLIADFVKGNNLAHYPTDIQAGIRLHRAIDKFTDSHRLVHESKQLFKPPFYLSAGVLTDILYDHFLANDVLHFTEVDLRKFTQSVYAQLNQHKHLFNEPMQHFFTHMSNYDWLLGYRYHEGLSKSILGICKRYPRLGNGEVALDIINLNKELFQSHYDQFFPELVLYTQKWIEDSFSKNK
jgi:acyl carrier protein phosphodiesterase